MLNKETVDKRHGQEKKAGKNMVQKNVQGKSRMKKTWTASSRHV
jgi:hypothetical protein